MRETGKNSVEVSETRVNSWRVVRDREKLVLGGKIYEEELLRRGWGTRERNFPRDSEKSIRTTLNGEYMIMGRGGSLVNTAPFVVFVRRVAGSNSALDPGQVQLTVAFRRVNSDTVSVLCRGRLWVVVDLNKSYRNSLNEWMNETWTDPWWGRRRSQRNSWGGVWLRQTSQSYSGEDGGNVWGEDSGSGSKYLMGKIWALETRDDRMIATGENAWWGGLQKHYDLMKDSMSEREEMEKMVGRHRFGAGRLGAVLIIYKAGLGPRAAPCQV